MKFEKRSSGEDSPETAQTESAVSGGSPEPSGVSPAPPAAGKKPVIMYIMILFIAAFLLMALSFFMHQRSNTEALGELQHSVTAMQEVQATQEKIIALQDEVDALQDEQEQLEETLQETQTALDLVDRRAGAFAMLIALEQAWQARDLDTCRELIGQMEAIDAEARLEETGDHFYTTPPLTRYQQLKEAVAAQPESAE